MTSNRSILVTGGGGYIGSHAVWRLKEAKYTPVVVDSLVSGHEWAARKFGVFEKGDIGDKEFIRRVCEKYHPVALMHFAAFIDVNESVRDPQKYSTNNFEKAKVLFDTVHACGVKQAIFSSTAAVYGAVESAGLINENVPLKPVNPYGESKLNAEQYLRSIGGMESIALRYFNVAGAAPSSVGIGEAHFPETHLIPKILLPVIGDKEVLKALNLDGTVKIFGTDYPTRDGTNVRDYIHVVDLADAHVKALDYLLKGGKTHIFNLGSKQGYTVKEVIAAAEKVLKTKIPVMEAPRRAGDPPSLVADSSKAKKLLGWEPKFGIEDMISSARDWHQSALYQQTVLAQ